MCSFVPLWSTNGPAIQRSPVSRGVVNHSAALVVVEVGIAGVERRVQEHRRARRATLRHHSSQRGASASAPGAKTMPVPASSGCALERRVHERRGSARGRRARGCRRQREHRGRAGPPIAANTSASASARGRARRRRSRGWRARKPRGARWPRPPSTRRSLGQSPRVVRGAGGGRRPRAATRRRRRRRRPGDGARRPPPSPRRRARPSARARPPRRARGPRRGPRGGRPARAPGRPRRGEPHERARLGLQVHLRAREPERPRRRRHLDVEARVGGAPLGGGRRRPRAARRAAPSRARSGLRRARGRELRRRARRSPRGGRPGRAARRRSARQPLEQPRVRRLGRRVHERAAVCDRAASRTRPVRRSPTSASRSVTVATPSCAASSASVGSWSPSPNTPTRMASASRRSTSATRPRWSSGASTARRALDGRWLGIALDRLPMAS